MCAHDLAVSITQRGASTAFLQVYKCGRRQCKSDRIYNYFVLTEQMSLIIAQAHIIGYRH